MDTKEKVILAVASIVTLGVIYFIYKKIKRSEETKDIRATVDDAKNEYDKMVATGERLSFPLLTYSSLINSVKNNLEGCELFSTEMTVVEDIIRSVKKPLDWYYIISKAGVISISDCGSWGTLKTDYTLEGLLKDQLDSSGFYTISIGTYSDKGYANTSFDVLSKYLKTINIDV